MDLDSLIVCILQYLLTVTLNKENGRQCMRIQEAACIIFSQSGDYDNNVKNVKFEFICVALSLRYLFTRLWS